MCLSATSSSSGTHFVDQAYQNCRSCDLPCERLESAQAIREALRARTSVPVGEFEGRVGYMNPTGGWAESGRALAVAIERVKREGGNVRAGAEVVGLLKEGKRVQGVRLKSGEEVKGDLVLVSSVALYI